MPRKTPAARTRNSWWRSCFNEAAARCRGKRQIQMPPRTRCPKASMRPRPDAAENAASWGTCTRPNRFRFNEAAARCRGKRGHGVGLRRGHGASMRPRPDAAENWSGRRTRNPRGAICFNEAAARCRGKPAGAGDLPRAHRLVASMRPRPDAAENSSATASTSACSSTLGFNEAAARCRGKHA